MVDGTLNPARSTLMSWLGVMAVAVLALMVIWTAAPGSWELRLDRGSQHRHSHSAIPVAIPAGGGRSTVTMVAPPPHQIQPVDRASARITLNS